MRRALLGVVLGALGGLVLVPGASAGVLPGWTGSVRWSGWIAAQPGVRFDRVSASWRVTSDNCPPHGGASYSLTWVGLGGANENKLEQIGTETDCAPSFGAQKSVPYSLIWWEVLPGSEQYPTQQVNPGDLIDASVTIAGHRAILSLRDVTRGWKFVKSRAVRPRDLTGSSADWIEEDPEICPGAVIYVTCPEKPFAHYRTVTFSHALAGAGHVTGPIRDSHWNAIRYGTIRGNLHPRLLSWPSPLNAAGNGFTVSRTDSGLPPEPV